MVFDKLRRLSLLILLIPRQFVRTDGSLVDFDFEAWSSSEYRWDQDAWSGLHDFAQEVEETLERGHGDCEDYAVVAASWALQNGREDVGLALCWEWPYPWSRHVIAYDADRVYSSGTIFQGSVDEWVDQSRYFYALERPV